MNKVPGTEKTGLSHTHNTAKSSRGPDAASISHQLPGHHIRRRFSNRSEKLNV